MKYVGSKNRLSKYIAPIIQKYIDDNNIQVYYEPFAGGLNMIDKIKCPTRIANDVHEELIHIWNALRGGWTPPEYISESEYKNVKENKDKYPSYYVGYVGFHSTFGGKYFGGYARSFKSDGITPRIMSNETYRNTMKQLPHVTDVQCVSWDYTKVEIHNAIIYCDPPYQNTTKYSTEKFDYEDFWQWCRDMNKHNIVLISEYNAPDDFECIWSKETLANFDCNRGEDLNKKKRVEKLFKWNGGVSIE